MCTVSTFYVTVDELREGYRRAVFGTVGNRVWICVYTPRDGTHRIISVKESQ